MNVWFPGAPSCVPASQIGPPPFDFVHGELRGRNVVATLFNSGRHLYFDRCWPRWYSVLEQPLFFLRYRDFCGCGRLIDGVRIQHLGHLYGIQGGPAQVAVEWNGIRWELGCEPCRFYYIVEFGGPQGVFKSRQTVFLPRGLLVYN